MVPLLLRLGSLGRIGVGATMALSSDEPEDESDHSRVGAGGMLPGFLTSIIQLLLAPLASNHYNKGRVW